MKIIKTNCRSHPHWYLLDRTTQRCSIFSAPCGRTSKLWSFLFCLKGFIIVLLGRNKLDWQQPTFFDRYLKTWILLSRQRKGNTISHVKRLLFEDSSLHHRHNKPHQEDVALRYHRLPHPKATPKVLIVSRWSKFTQLIPVRVIDVLLSTSRS